ncbi:MAG: hypothetical protein MUO58_11150 [Anaerolineales bacterium]|nr:hypothetical protein [Anaerolineales bacterium]
MIDRSSEECLSRGIAAIFMPAPHATKAILNEVIPLPPRADPGVRVGWVEGHGEFPAYPYLNPPLTVIKVGP